MSLDDVHNLRLSAVVGRNVQRARLDRGWDRERLCDEAALLDLDFSAASLERIENGSEDLSVVEMVALAVLLGVAPHLLMYPPADATIAVGGPGTYVGRGDRPEALLLEAETHIGADEFADWIWDPDGHVRTLVSIEESELWSAARRAR